MSVVPPRFVFDANHIHKEATVDTADSEKECQNILHNFYKEGYIQSNVGSHISTGVP